MEIYNDVVWNLDKTAADAKAKEHIRTFFSAPKKKTNSVQTNKADETILVEYEAILAAAKEVHVKDEDGEEIITKNLKPV